MTVWITIYELWNKNASRDYLLGAGSAENRIFDYRRLIQADMPMNAPTTPACAM